MEEAITIDRWTLVTQARRGFRLLLLRTPVLVEAGQTFWMDLGRQSLVVATGITATGGREVLGLAVGDSEEETFWRAFLTDLKHRGLSGVRLVISDQHAGPVKALRRSFQGVAHQRCRVHFARNLLALVPKSHKDMVAALFRTSSPNRTARRSHRSGTRSVTSSPRRSRRPDP